MHIPKKTSTTFIVIIKTLILISFVACKHDKPKKDFIDTLISKMTLEEKAGQLNLIPYSDNQKDSIIEWIKEGRIGGLLKSNGAKQNLELQTIAVKQSRLGIPILFQEDVIHGYKTITPIPLAETASWDLDAIKNSAALAAREAASSGIHLTYAPMVDVARDPRWGRIIEGAGEDPYLGSLVAEARVKGFQEANNIYNNLLATVKHFVGYSASLAGRDYNIRDVSERELREVHLPAFKAAVDANVSSVMSAYSAYDGVPAVANNYLMKKVLREEFGFEGVVISDWETITNLVKTGIAKNDTIAVKMAIEAGNDFDMSSKRYEKLIPEMVKKGLISESDVNKAVRNVLLLKQKADLFKNPFAYFNIKKEKNELLSEENLFAAKQMALKSMVLLKNKNNILPINNKQSKIAIIGPFAKAQKDLLGWWSCQGNPNDVVSIHDGFEKRLDRKLNYAQGCIVEDFDIKGVEKIKEAVRIAEKSDVVIMVLGEKEWMSGEGGGTASLLLPGAQQQLLDEVSKTGTPIITVIVSGRPYVLTDVVKKSHAVLQAWMPGTMGGDAVADIIFGDFNPCGKLPVSFPYHQGQIPIFYSYKRTSHSFSSENNNRYTTSYRDIQNEPLFPFGYGLSYNEYEYSNLILDKKNMTKNDSIKVSICIKNNGIYKGREIVQLYIQDKLCSVTRPFKELKDFKILELEPGETKSAHFYICSEKLKFIDKDYKYTLENGEFIVFVGPNSVNTKSCTFNLN